MKPRLSSERKWLFAFTLCVIVLTSLPYAIAWLRQGSEWVFTGFVFGVEDGNSYIAKMLAGAQGDWLFRSAYTAMEQGGALLYLPYLLLGKLLGPSAQHGQLVLLLHLFRVGATAVLCVAAYEFLAYFLANEKLRRLGLLLCLFGGGLGWLLLLAGQGNWLGEMPLDFYSPETFGFIALYGLPHLALARAGLLWGLLIYLRQSERVWQVALLWLGLALCHTITAGLGILLIGLHWLLSRLLRSKVQPTFASIAWPMLGAGPVLLVNLLQLLGDEYLQIWAGQNTITSPHPAHYLIAYGLLLPFALIGLRSLLQKERFRGGFLLMWLVLLPILLYFPVNLQRRFAEGAWVLLVVLALNAFEHGKVVARWRGLFALSFPSTVIFLGLTSFAALNPAQPQFRPAAEVAMFSALRAEAERDAPVLAGYETSNALPAWVPLRVLIGHGPESAGLKSLQPRVEAFYAQGSAELIADFEIDYVVRGPEERKLGSWPVPDGLELIYDKDGYAIYRMGD
jgi:hypothetical protein